MLFLLEGSDQQNEANPSALCQVLAQNSGYDPQETLVKVQAEHMESGQLTGVDLNTGKDSLSHR